MDLKLNQTLFRVLCHLEFPYLQVNILKYPDRTIIYEAHMFLRKIPDNSVYVTEGNALLRKRKFSNVLVSWRL